MNVTRLAHLILAGGGLVGVLLLGGCGQRSSVGTVTGKVLYKQNPVPFGLIQFYRGDQLLGASVIGPDGQYSVDNIPPGEVTVCVLTKQSIPENLPTPPPPDPSGGKQAAGDQPATPGDTPPPPPPLPPNAQPTLPGMPAGGAPGGGPGGPPGKPGAGPPAIPGGPGMGFDSTTVPPHVRAKFEPVHEKYGTPSKSNKRYTVEAGTQLIDVLLD